MVKRQDKGLRVNKCYSPRRSAIKEERSNKG